MARYTHKVSGARVEVRDDKVMDSSWELEGEKNDQPKPVAKRAAARKSE